MELKICIGEYCHLKGSEVIVKKFKKLLEEKNLNAKIDLKGCFCMGKCHEDGISVMVNETIHKIDPDKVDGFFNDVVLPSIK